MALIIEAINEIYSLENNKNVKLFLGGGITNCPDWQSVLIEDIKEIPNLTIYNPRRKNFPIENPNASEAQITWEFNHLRDADIVLFWFAQGSLNPIVLYELGMWGNSNQRPMIVGVDPAYEIKQDVIIQTQLAKPDQIVLQSLDAMSEELFSILKY
jgi:hypothetical protein